MSLDISLYMMVDVGHTDLERVEFYSWNFTHNTAEMAEAAGFYKYLWRGDENGIVYGKDLARALENGLKTLAERPEHFRQWDAPNGWGTYDQFVPALEELLENCLHYPAALVSFSR